jgi:hypothetical protein
MGIRHKAAFKLKYDTFASCLVMPTDDHNAVTKSVLQYTIYINFIYNLGHTAT